MGRRYYGEQEPPTWIDLAIGVIVVLVVFAIIFLAAIAPFIILAKLGGW